MNHPPSHPPPRFRRLHPDDPRRIGPYTLIGRIGAGGMGTVYAGRAGDGRVVSVKVVHPRLASDPDFRARFAREVEMASRIVGPRVPAVLGSDLESDRPWLATEYVLGSDLGDLVRSRGPLPRVLLPGLAAGVASALADIHRNGVVHRDLKPANVMISPGGPRVLDLGIARPLDETALTRTGGLVGTPGWIAPELYEGGDPSPAADLFGWGCLVAYAATGAAPFGEGPGEVSAYRISRTAPEPRGLPEDVLPLVERALDPDPERRPSADEVVRALSPTEPVEALLARTWTGVRAQVPEPAFSSGASRRRRRSVTAAAGAVIAIVALGAVAGLLSSTTENPVPSTDDTAEQLEEPTWDPPEAVADGVNLSLYTEVTLDEDGSHTFWSSEGRNFYSASPQSVSVTEPPGVAFTMTGGGMPARDASFIPGSFTILTPDAEFEETGSRPPADEIDFDTREVTLTFADAPPRGLLVFGDRERYEPHVSGAQPVGLCYDAEDGAFSLDFDTCLAEIAVDHAQGA
ncbi:serine/threonine-protein kinase [Nocardiopsis sp. LDBS1602]|uniref:serine/threonine-protein kinase n=1 Tax=Nocardiopsis sp. LDBS1602 TaxID=3109597 RepID=UPI002DB617CE|nr:serine/threonine-protein kinase [Nocardiopsis sp. LDBS1602]MEC3895646.1 serine/threonine-protein kinase [Nocardiopsis sp. LDBS1602]